MKIKKRIIVIMICLLILTIIAPELYIFYTEYTLKKELKAAIKDYTIEYCNKEVEVKRIDFSFSWNEVYWKVESEHEIYGGVYDGIVRLNSAPCTEHIGFILHREKQRFIEYHDLLDPPNFGEANLFYTYSYRHPVHTALYFVFVAVCLILILSLLLVYIKLNQKDKSEKERD